MAEAKVTETLAAKIPVLGDHASAPAIFAEDIRGFSVSSGIAKLPLVEYRVSSATNDIVGVPVAVLIIPADKLVAWGEFLIRHGKAALADKEESQPNGD